MLQIRLVPELTADPSYTGAWGRLASPVTSARLSSPIQAAWRTLGPRGVTTVRVTSIVIAPGLVPVGADLTLALSPAFADGYDLGLLISRGPTDIRPIDPPEALLFLGPTPGDGGSSVTLADDRRSAAVSISAADLTDVIGVGDRVVTILRRPIGADPDAEWRQAGPDGGPLELRVLRTTPPPT